MTDTAIALPTIEAVREMVIRMADDRAILSVPYTYTLEGEPWTIACDGHALLALRGERGGEPWAKGAPEFSGVILPHPTEGWKPLDAGALVAWADAAKPDPKSCKRERVVALEIALGMFPAIPPQTSEAYGEVQELLSAVSRGAPEPIIPTRSFLMGISDDPRPVDWHKEWEIERGKFQQETLRASRLSDLVRRFVDEHHVRGGHPAERWTKECDLCVILADALAELRGAAPAVSRGPAPTDPLVVLGRGLAKACAAHDVRPGEVVQFEMVPHIWNAYAAARDALNHVAAGEGERLMSERLEQVRQRFEKRVTLVGDLNHRAYATADIAYLLERLTVAERLASALRYALDATAGAPAKWYIPVEHGEAWETWALEARAALHGWDTEETKK